MYSRAGVRVWACWPARHSTAPMVNSATGDAASASMRTTTSGGPARRMPAAENAAPSAIDHGSGLAMAPRRARRNAWRQPAPAASWACANAMHNELVMNRSTRMVLIIGPATCGPISATSSGTPMKPVFGKAATSAPKAASFRCTLPAQREGDGGEDHHQRTQRVDQQHRRIEQLEHRRVHAEAEQQARQREVQHEGIQTRDGASRAARCATPPASRRPPARRTES